MAATIMILSLLPAGEAAAQDELGGLRLGAWRGEIEMGYAAQHQQTRPGDGTESDFRHRRLRERLGIRNDGFSVLDPRLVSGNLGLTFDLFQDRDRSNGEETSRHGTLTGYAFDTTLLGAKPYNATLYANRDQAVLTQPFGGRIEIDHENRGATLRLREDSILRDWGAPYFSSTLSAYQEHFQETTTSFGQTFRRDELRNVASFDARKGFETSDLDFRYEYNDLDNLAYAPGSFTTHRANLDYSADFGPGLNRRWDSRLSYWTRTGQSPITFFIADERVHVDHYKNLSTDYEYLLNRISTPQGTTDTHNGFLRARHHLYSNLTTNGLASAMYQDLPDGTRSSYAGQLDFHYQRSLPWDGRVFARVAGREQLDEHKLAAANVSVVDEPHTAPAPLGGGAGFLLDQRFVVVSSIVVVDARGGARLPTSLGVDYDIVQEGDFVRIVPLASSLVIQPGDPLLASYTYQVDTSIKYSTESLWLSAGVDFRWIAFSLAHEQSDQKLLSGSGQFLEDRRRDSAELRLRGAWEALQAEAGAEVIRYDSTRLAYTQERFNERVSYRPWTTMTLALNAEESSTRYTQPERQSDTYSLGLTIDWLAPGGWSTTTFFGRRVLEDSVLPTETIDEASFRARLTYGKLEITTLVGLNERKRADFQTTDRRVELRVIRRFGD